MNVKCKWYIDNVLNKKEEIIKFDNIKSAKIESSKNDEILDQILFDAECSLQENFIK